ncbi:hypothetical protein TWF506_009126 [Arthrobotrys conoides]|uniref:Protein kinase domain-containing protein n=1 Tax=Arthrobotrys conoides TaxID=74498 RepID=A0AAN8PE67_9PEZI
MDPIETSRIITSRVETVAELLARPLPQIIQRDNTDPENTLTDENIHPDHISFWNGFLEDVEKTISETDLSQNVSLTDALGGESVVVGSKQGLQGRFNANVGVAFARAFIATSGAQGGDSSTSERLKDLKFADAEVLSCSWRAGTPDVVVVELQVREERSTPLLRAVGEVTRYWTARGFNNIRISEGPGSTGREFLKNYTKEIGQLINFMLRSRLRYGFISNYESTIFVRRVEAKIFELTDPIGFQDVGPTVRQCFYHFGTLLLDDPNFKSRGREVDLGDLKIPPSRDSAKSPVPNSRPLKRPAPDDESPKSGDEGPESQEVDRPGPSKRSRTGSMATTKAPNQDSGNIRSEEAEETEHLPSIQREDTLISPGNNRTQSPQEEEETTGVPTDQPSSAEEKTDTIGASPEVGYNQIRISDITSRTIIFKDETDGYLFDTVEVIKENRQNGKRVFRGIFQGQDAIAKYWPESLVKLYKCERNTYHHLPPCPYFARMLAYGNLVVSSSLKKGHIIIITLEEGIPLGYKLLEKTSTAEKKRIRTAFIEAIKVLRGRDSMHGDPQPSNVLWDSETGGLKLLDLETMWDNYDGDPADKVEVLGVLGAIEDDDEDDAMDGGE